jgi:hypothetical protein
MDTIKKDTGITAIEALTIANSSEVVKKRIYKIIKEAATEGCLQTTYGFEHPSIILVNSIVQDLTERGFTVKADQEDDFVQLSISWGN